MVKEFHWPNHEVGVMPGKLAVTSVGVVILIRHLCVKHLRHLCVSVRHLCVSLRHLYVSVRHLCVSLRHLCWCFPTFCPSGWAQVWFQEWQVQKWRTATRNAGCRRRGAAHRHDRSLRRGRFSVSQILVRFLLTLPSASSHLHKLTLWQTLKTSSVGRTILLQVHAFIFVAITRLYLCWCDFRKLHSEYNPNWWKIDSEEVVIKQNRTGSTSTSKKTIVSHGFPASTPGTTNTWFEVTCNVWPEITSSNIHYIKIDFSALPNHITGPYRTVLYWAVCNVTYVGLAEWPGHY